MPKVSICIPVRNGASFIKQAVDSALIQSFRDFEIVIVDNCSTDETPSLVRTMMLGDDRIHLYHNDCDLGLVGNLNRCLQLARGEYIKFLMVDDMLLQGCLEKMVHRLDDNPEIVLVAGGRLIIDENGKSLSLQRFSRKIAITTGSKAIRKCLSGGNYIGEPTAVMFRRTEMARGFNADLAQLTDLEMWFQLLERGDLLCIPEPLVAIRRHPGQLSNANEKSDILVEDFIALFRQYRYKPYIKWTLFHSLQHQFRMASRLWRSRHYLHAERRRFLVVNYSSVLAYYGYAPLIAPALNCWRLLKKKLLDALHLK